MTCDMWQVTCDMRQVTHDMWHMVGGQHSLKILAPMVWGIQCLEDIFTKDEVFN